MKKASLLLLIAFCCLGDVLSQVVLEKTHFGFQFRNPYDADEFFLSEIDDGLYKYVYINYRPLRG